MHDTDIRVIELVARPSDPAVGWIRRVLRELFPRNLEYHTWNTTQEYQLSSTIYCPPGGELALGLRLDWD